MGYIEFDCRDSPSVEKGETWSTHYCNITVVEVYDTNSGKISVDGLSIDVLEDNQYDIDNTFRVKVTTIFYGSTSTKIMQFTVCGITEDIPLTVSSITLNEYDPGRVTASITVEGTGTGTLKITWGNETVTTHTVQAGDYGYVRTMPAGTHEICAEVI